MASRRKPPRLRALGASAGHARNRMFDWRRQLRANDCRPGRQRAHFTLRGLAAARDKAAISTRIELRRQHVLQRPANAARHDFRRFDVLGAHVNRAEQDVLPTQLAQHRHVHTGTRALDRHLIHTTLREERQRDAVMAPVGVLGLPRQYGRRAVAVADVHRRASGHTLHALLQRIDAPCLDIVDIDVEARLVELHDVGASRGEVARFGIERAGEAHRQRLAIGAVMFVGHAVHDRHRARQRDLELPRGQIPREPTRVDEHRTRPLHRTDNARDFRRR